MPLPLHIKAPAKINLFLNLLHPREDGFHEVRFVMQELTLADTLSLTPQGEQLQINLTCNLAELSGPDNLIIQAYHRFYQQHHLPPIALQVHLEKQIPIQAGLGGGSSDAAAMLTALNRLHGDILDRSHLHALAGQLGSDVPFFLYGGTCIAEGRGEHITPCPPLPEHGVVLLKPRHFGISTAHAYQRIREARSYQVQPFTIWDTHLKKPSPFFSLQKKDLYNDFERILFPRYPILWQAKQTLDFLGLDKTLLSGSGPTLFTLTKNIERDLPVIQSHFSHQDWIIIATGFARSLSQE